MKILSLVFPKKEKIAPLEEEHPQEPVRILEAKENGDKVSLRVAMSREFYDDLYEFLKQKGYVSYKREKDGMSILLEFGLSEESREELERNRDEMWKVSSRYAAISFKTSEYYERNFEITKGLTYHIRLNKELKRELKEKGLGDYVSKDEWDNWDDNFVDRLYNRYVFKK
jgi:hypothetical protein